MNTYEMLQNMSVDEIIETTQMCLDEYLLATEVSDTIWDMDEYLKEENIKNYYMSEVIRGVQAIEDSY